MLALALPGVGVSPEKPLPGVCSIPDGWSVLKGVISHRDRLFNSDDDGWLMLTLSHVELELTLEDATTAPPFFY